MKGVFYQKERQAVAAKEDKKAQHRAELVTVGVACLLAGFVLSGYAGWALTWVDGWSDLKFATAKEIPPWISALTAVIAAAISAYAVYLVASTLRATQDTLRITQNIGDAQTRPWVLVKPVDIKNDSAGASFYVTFCNYGPTPAKNAFLMASVECLCWEDPNADFLNTDDCLKVSWAQKSKYKKFFAPSENETFVIPCPKFNFPKNARIVRLEVTTRYSNWNAVSESDPYEDFLPIDLSYMLGDLSVDE